MFHTTLSENCENLDFPLNGVSWSKSVTVITERPANAFSGIIINISANHESISFHNSLEAIKS